METTFKETNRTMVVNSVTENNGFKYTIESNYEGDKLIKVGVQVTDNQKNEHEGYLSYQLNSISISCNSLDRISMHGDFLKVIVNKVLQPPYMIVDKK